jgi:hypothetical protein
LIRPLIRDFQTDKRDYYPMTRTKFVVGDVDLDILPQEFVSRNVAEAQEPLFQALSCLAVDKSAKEPFSTSLRFIALALEHGEREVCVSGTVDLTDPQEMEQFLPDHRVKECFELLLSPDDLGTLPPLEAVAAEGEEFARYLTKVTRRVSGTDPLPCRLHSGFLESLQTSSIATNASAMESLVRACASVLAEQAASVHGLRLEHFRDSESPSSPQRIRASDGAEGWRVSLSMGRAGWRLNFWRVPASPGASTDAIEFARVEKHNTPRPQLPD